MPERKDFVQNLLPKSWLGLATRLLIITTVTTGGAVSTSRNPESQMSKSIPIGAVELSKNHIRVTFLEMRSSDHARSVQILNANDFKITVFRTFDDEDYLSSPKWSPVDSNILMFGYGFAIRQNGGLQTYAPDQFSEVYVFDLNSYKLKNIAWNHTKGMSRVNSDPKWTQEGKIVYMTSNGKYIMESDGTNQKPYFD